MNSTRSRFIGVAVIVCVFAIGMATFLNYYKYHTALENMVRARLLVIAHAIDNGIQSALSLGVGFTELSTLHNLLARQAASDSLVLGIDVVDTSGHVLYST